MLSGSVGRVYKSLISQGQKAGFPEGISVPPPMALAWRSTRWAIDGLLPDSIPQLRKVASVFFEIPARGWNGTPILRPGKVVQGLSGTPVGSLRVFFPKPSLKETHIPTLS